MALTSRFVSAVRRQGSIPSTYLASDILEAGDGEIQAVFIPLLESVRQNFFVREMTGAVDERGRIPLPTRAISAALRNVQLQVGNSWVPLPNRALEEADSLSGGQPAAYYLDAGSVALLPTGSSGTLRIRYTSRPGRMVLDTDGATSGVISGVTPGPTTTAIATAYVGTPTVDIISSGPAHQQKAIDVVSAAVPNTSLTEMPIAGDYVCAPDTSPFVPLPEELFAALVHRTTGIILRAQAYDEEASIQLSIADEAIKATLPMLLPRNEGNPQRFKGGMRRALNISSNWRR